jgi:hypothetical protein
MLPNGSLEQISSRAKLKGYDVAYAPSFRNNLFSVAKFCNDDNKVFLFTNTKTYGICVNESTRSLLHDFIDTSEKCDCIQVSGIRDMKSNIYTASVDNIKPYSASCSCTKMPPQNTASTPQAPPPIPLTILSDSSSQPALPHTKLSDPCKSQQASNVYYQTLQFPELRDLVRFWHETWNHADVETMVAIVQDAANPALPGVELLN